MSEQPNPPSNVLKDTQRYKNVFPNILSPFSVGIPTSLVIDESKVPVNLYFGFIKDKIEFPVDQSSIVSSKSSRQYSRTLQTRCINSILQEIEKTSPSYFVLYENMKKLLTNTFLEIIYTVIFRSELASADIPDDEDARWLRYEKQNEVVHQVQQHCIQEKLDDITLFKTVNFDFSMNVPSYIKEVTEKASTEFKISVTSPDFSEPMLTTQTTASNGASALANDAHSPRRVDSSISRATTAGTHVIDPLAQRTPNLIPITNGNNGSGNAATANVNGANYVIPNIQLSVQDPRDFELPIFKGEFSKWNYWWNTFQSLIDSDKTVSNSVKLNRLMRSLRGRALQEVQHLSLTDDNYEKVKSILRREFGKPELVVTSMLQEIESYPKIGHQNSPEFKKFVDLLVQFQLHGKAYMPTIFEAPLSILRNIYKIVPRIVVEKWMSEKTRLEYLEPTPEHFVPKKFDAFITFLKTTSSNVENTNLALGNSQNSFSNFQKKSNPRNYYNASFATSTKQNCANFEEQLFLQNNTTNKSMQSSQQRVDSNKFNNNSQLMKSQMPKGQHQQAVSTSNKPTDNKRIISRPCELCGSREHAPTRCTKSFPSTKKLMDYIVKNKLCLNCFRSGHFTMDCKSASNCGVGNCVRKHHKRLHGMPRLLRGKQNN